MARPAGSKNAGRAILAKPQAVDPLLAALFARVPPPDTVWPVASRAAWLEMVERAFDVLYSGSAADAMNDMMTNHKPNGRGAPAPAKPADHAFYIDRENYARMAGGERINAVEVDGPLFDLRGEGDLGAIIWADGSTGVLGKVLDVKPA